MRFVMKHEIRGRMRIRAVQKRMTCREADILVWYIGSVEGVTSVKVRERVMDAVICYEGERERILAALRGFHYEDADAPETYLQNSGRKLSRHYQEKLAEQVLFRAGTRLFLPLYVQAAITAVRSVHYLLNGARTLAQGKLKVPVLDAAAIGVSMIRGDMDTAGSIMFLLGIGETLEEWTHKKSVADLARSMSLQVEKVWCLRDDRKVLLPVSEIACGDRIIVHMGNIIPFDGSVSAGEAMVNQSSLTGESLPVRKGAGSTVYAGTMLEEGELTITVREAGGGSKYEKIIQMIEDSEKLKSTLESKAEHLADVLVPYTLAGTALVYLLTRNTTKALAVLLVDFSCALKLAMPICVLSAIREASEYRVTVKGGRYLEDMSEADTIVFDKTGTLTKAQPTVVDVISFCEEEPDELLRLAACMEEHFPHSMAKAVVDAARAKNLQHDETHAKVEYVVAHGISTMVEGRRAVIGSYHFVFEDEHCAIPEGMQERFDSVPDEYSHLYLSIEQTLAAVICIEDPLRAEAAEAVSLLKREGIGKVVMMTGDSERTAAAIAARVGVDEYFSEVLPEDKARFIEREKAAGRKAVMVGDGINDSPALSAASVGIAISDGAEIAREIADITVGADNLYELVTLKRISNRLTKRIRWNYRVIVGFNAGLIVLGVAGVMPPTISALLHNTSTLAISLRSMRNLLPDQR